ncbi:putative leader peptide [Pseudofrankia inefficax]
MTVDRDVTSQDRRRAHTGAPRPSGRVLLLTRRRHVDLMRNSGAVCP